MKQWETSNVLSKIEVCKNSAQNLINAKNSAQNNPFVNGQPSQQWTNTNKIQISPLMASHKLKQISNQRNVVSDTAF